MSWRGQGGKRAKGRRGDQDPELDNTAWLAELEREAAAQADDDEDDWASTLRGRRSPAPPPQSPPDAGWASPPDQGAAPNDAGPGNAPGSGADPGPGGASSGGDPDWTWRSPDADAFGEQRASTQADPDGGWERYREAAAPETFGGARQDVEAGWEGSQPAHHGWGDPGDGDDPGSWAAPGDGADRGSWADAGDEDHGGWRSAGVDTPTGAWDAVEPVGREPDYPALFGELYRRSAAQQDPIWEAPPAVEPMPEPGQPDPPAAARPFEETTQSWEPSDRSFIWPSDELPSTQPEWDQPGSTDWLDDPAPPAVPPPEPDQTAAWPAPEPGARAWEDPAPEPEASPWADQPGAGNGVPPTPPAGPTIPAPPPPTGSMGPPPDDWAAAIPSDVPAARRAADPSATQVWRPDQGADAEPGVPLGPGTRSRAPAPQAPAGERPGGRATRSRGPAGGAPPGAGPLEAAGGAGPGTGVAGRGGGPGRRERRPPRDPQGATDLAGGEPAAQTARRFGRGASEAGGEPGAGRGASAIDTGKGRGNRQDGERQARAWPRVVAVISWIVLVMVLCWYYVFPWLERMLPENF